MIVCVLGAVALGACGGDDDSSGTGGSTGTGGKGGSGGAVGGAGGGGGSGGASGGSGGATGGSGGTAGATGGSGGATGGSGGATGGSGGATGGSGGATGGSGGATGGSGGATGGSGGATGGSGGATGGSGGATGGSGGATGGSGGTGGGTGGTGGGATCGSVTCGAAPYQCFSPVVAMIMAATPQTATTVSTNICPTANLQVPYQGQSAIQVERNKPFFFIGEQTGSLTAFSIEYNVKSTFFATLPALLSVYPPTYPATVDPAWSSTTKALIHVLINATKGGATAPCDDKSGVTFAVTGHPEAVVKYPNNGTSTGSGGDAKATITIVTTGTKSVPEFVYVTATKGSCALGLNGADQLFLTGRTPVAINTVTSGVGFEISN
ncbi:MAG: hypothetical protein IT375_26790 [Polyangiaceae bacterium]|nr:hypothetical protein [Polyangiaceae bacterium]